MTYIYVTISVVGLNFSKHVWSTTFIFFFWNVAKLSLDEETEIQRSSVNYLKSNSLRIDIQIMLKAMIISI